MRSPLFKPSEATIQTPAPSRKSMRHKKNLDEKWNGDEDTEIPVITSNSVTVVSIYDAMKNRVSRAGDGTGTDHLPVNIDIVVMDVDPPTAESLEL
jgi:hypothetical protein